MGFGKALLCVGAGALCVATVGVAAAPIAVCMGPKSIVKSGVTTCVKAGIKAYGKKMLAESKDK